MHTQTSGDGLWWLVCTILWFINRNRRKSAFYAGNVSLTQFWNRKMQGEFAIGMGFIFDSPNEFPIPHGYFATIAIILFLFGAYLLLSPWRYSGDVTSGMPPTITTPAENSFLASASSNRVIDLNEINFDKE